MSRLKPIFLLVISVYLFFVEVPAWFLLCAPILQTGNAVGDFLDLPLENTSQNPSGEYSAPNETYPQEALSFYQSAPTGAYVSVGTERGFIAAANSPEVTHLVLLYSDPGVTSYNRVNVLLLRIAKDRQVLLR